MSTWLQVAGAAVIGVGVLANAWGVFILTRWLKDVEARYLRLMKIVAEHAASLDMLEHPYVVARLRKDGGLGDVTEPPKQS